MFVRKEKIEKTFYRYEIIVLLL